MVAARFTAAPRFVNEFELASTSRMWQPEQIAETMSRTSEISSAQPTLLRGGLVVPFRFTLRKQPLALMHEGRPNWLRYTARSDSAFGSSEASTIAMVSVAEPVAVRLYAEWRPAGPQPAGVVSGAMAAAFLSSRTQASLAAIPAVAAE